MGLGHWRESDDVAADDDEGFGGLLGYCLMIVDGSVGHSVRHVGRGVGGCVGRSMGHDSGSVVHVGGGISGSVGHNGRGVVHVGRGVGSISWGMGHHGGVGDGLNDGSSQRGLADDSVESVDGVGSVVDGAAGAIGLGQGVLAGDHISVAGLVLVLVVSGHGILDVVGEGVLGMGVILDLL